MLCALCVYLMLLCVKLCTLYFMNKAAVFWSGGKDAAMALHKAKQDPLIQVVGLVTTLNKGSNKTAGHKIKEAVLDRQAIQTGLPLRKMWVNELPDNNEYENQLLSIYAQLRSEGIRTVIYGDIFLQDIKTYREELLKRAGMKPMFPLWQMDSRMLMTNFVESGFKAITCSIDTSILDESFLGKELNAQFLENLPEVVDPAGENGEFHTFCFDGPVFNKAVRFETGTSHSESMDVRSTQQTLRNTFAYIDIL